MAIKTAAEIFGDGTAGNPQVPIDLNAPPGYNALSRGVAFGEQVTSAIKNRTPYALAENDEDLNTRLADFEVRGLDGAYDLGTLGPAGGGRIINKDEGAVETVSLLTVGYGDDVANAHFRANMSGDTLDGGTGFDARVGVGRKSPGYVDRIAVGLTDPTGTLIDAAGQACTLASGGTNRIRLDSGGQWKLSSVTQLTLLREIVEVSGGLAAENGLYVLASFITDTTASFVKLDGTAASFTAGTATVTLYRRKFASSQYAGDGNKGGLFHGVPGGYAALTLMSGMSDSVDSGGATNTLRIPYKTGAGALLDNMLVDLYGRIVHNLSSQYLAAETENRWGAYGHLIDKVASSHAYEAGFIFQAPNAVANTYGVQSMLGTDTAAVPEACAFAFTASVTNLDFTGASGGSDFQTEVPIGTLVQILSPAAQAGYYVLTAKVGADTTVATLATLGGASPGFPTTSTGTARFLTGVSLGRRSFSNLDAPAGNFSTISDAKVAMHLQAEEGSGGLLITMTENGDEGIRIHKAGGGAVSADNTQDRLIFATNVAGEVYSSGSHYTEGEYLYQDTTGKLRLTTIPPQLGQSNSLAGTAYWLLNNAFGANSWKNRTDSSDISFPIMLPNGAVLQDVHAIVKQGAVPTSPMSMRVYKRQNMVFAGAPAEGSSLQIGGTDTGTVAITTQALNVGPTLAETIDNSDNTYMVTITASDGGAPYDEIFGIRLSWEDPGPRNH